MHKIVFGITLCLLWSSLPAQLAELEIKGIFGECEPVYAAAGDGLILYRQPDLRSERIELPYRKGWLIPAPKHEGLTRVLSIGSLKVIKPDPDLVCSVAPTDGPAELIKDEIVEYLHYGGEGFGAIRFRGAQCSAAVIEDFGLFESIRQPDVQVWLKVFFADGSSPGWLLHDGSQTLVARVLC